MWDRQYLPRFNFELTAVAIDTTDSQISIQQPLLSIILPVFNGRDKIRKTLQSLRSKLEQIEPEIEKLGKQNQELATLQPYPPYEIIVVDDGSVDGTKILVERIMGENPDIRLVSYESNKGKGYAIKEGVHASRGKYVIFMDGDGEIGTDVLAKCLHSLATADIVIGSKNHKRSVVRAPASRKVLSRLFQVFVRTMLGLKVGDTQVGLKAGNGEAFRKIFQHVTINRYAFDAEMLAIASVLGLRIKELPVQISLRKSFKRKDIVRMAVDVIGIAYKLRITRWYQKTLS